MVDADFLQDTVCIGTDAWCGARVDRVLVWRHGFKMISCLERLCRGEPGLLAAKHVALLLLLHLLARPLLDDVLFQFFAHHHILIDDCGSARESRRDLAIGRQYI